MTLPAVSQDAAPGPYEAGLLRALRAEAALQERIRILDQLRDAAMRWDRQARSTGSRTPAVTGPGRRSAGLRQAIDLLEGDPPAPGEQWGSASSAADSVDTYWYDPVEEQDEMPVRLVANDGAMSVSAEVYLTLEQAEQHARDVDSLIAKLTQQRAARAPAAESDQQEG